MPLGRPGAGFDLIEQKREATASDLAKVLADGGQRRAVVSRLWYVVETDEADSTWNRTAGFVERAENTDRHRIVGREDRGDIGHAGEHPAGVVSRARRPVAPQRRRYFGARLLERATPPDGPLARLEPVGRTRDVPDGLVTMSQQVGGSRVGAGVLVDCDDIDIGVGVALDGDNGKVGRKVGQRLCEDASGAMMTTPSTP